MKVSIDGIIGSAERIKSQKKLDEENLSDKKKQVRGDSVSIEKKINSRLERIEKDIRDIQSHLTKNQIIRDGIEQLSGDLRKGGANQQEILHSITFEGEDVLHNYVGDNITDKLLENKSTLVGEFIQDNISNLKNLQVELDNIMASDLTGKDKIQNIQTSIDSIISDGLEGNIQNISSLKADSVMRLIK